MKAFPHRLITWLLVALVSPALLPQAKCQQSADQTPVITSSAGAASQVGMSFTYQIAATNGPASYNATGLPPGLTVDTTNGVIAGIPVDAPGFYPVALSERRMPPVRAWATLTLLVGS